VEQKEKLGGCISCDGHQVCKETRGTKSKAVPVKGNLTTQNDKTQKHIPQGSQTRGDHARGLQLMKKPTETGPPPKKKKRMALYCRQCWGKGRGGIIPPSQAKPPFVGEQKGGRSDHHSNIFQKERSGERNDYQEKIKTTRGGGPRGGPGRDSKGASTGGG